MYLVTAQRLKAQQGKGGKDDGGPATDVDQLDFEFVLFASAVMDYDYIMGLMSRFSQQGPGKQKMSREQLIGLIQADAKFMNERDDIAAYNKSSIEAMEIKYPAIEERQKITGCLSSLEELVASETQKLNALKTHKKGLMQQLFPTVQEVAA